MPAGVPRGAAGPRLIALSALLMVCFRLSKRRCALFLEQVLGKEALAAWMVKLQNRAAALEEPYRELAKALPGQPAVNADESPTREGPTQGLDLGIRRGGLHRLRPADQPQGPRGRRTPGQVLRRHPRLHRAKMYWAFGRLQWCWAHLIRDFQALIDRPCGVSKRLGHDLHRQTRAMFALWNRVRDGTLRHADFRAQMKPVWTEIERLILRGKFDGKTRGVCKEL